MGQTTTAFTKNTYRLKLTVCKRARRQSINECDKNKEESGAPILTSKPANASRYNSKVKELVSIGKTLNISETKTLKRHQIRLSIKSGT